MNSYDQARNAIQISKSSVISNWPIDLARHLPELSAILLEQKESYSLQRLQLVSISVEMITQEKPKPNISKKRLSRFNGSDELLTLNSGFITTDQTILEISIDFFICGQRKYMLPASLSMKNEQVLFPIEAKAVETFFMALDQANTFLFDQKLSELNGKKTPLIPSQMIYALFLMHILVVMKQNFLFYRHFSVTFHENVCQNQIIKLFYHHDQTSFYAKMSTDNVCLSLTARN